ncbi:MAG: PH domain-containing protein [Vicinamibacterales bacterium]
MSDLQRLDPRYVTVQRITGWIMFAIIMSVWTMGFAIVFWTGEQGLRWILWTIGVSGAMLAPLLIWLATGWPALSYRYAAYRIDDLGMEIHSGAFIRSITTVPRSRVQHTDVEQGPLERRFGLGTLVVYTAGTHHARVELPGLEYDTAKRMRDMLLPKHGADAV